MLTHFNFINENRGQGVFEFFVVSADETPFLGRDNAYNGKSHRKSEIYVLFKTARRFARRHSFSQERPNFRVIRGQKRDFDGRPQVKPN